MTRFPACPIGPVVSVSRIYRKTRPDYADARECTERPCAVIFPTDDRAVAGFGKVEPLPWLFGHQIVFERRKLRW